MIYMPRYSCNITLKLNLVADNKKIAHDHFSKILGDVVESCPHVSYGCISNFERKYKNEQQ